MVCILALYHSGGGQGDGSLVTFALDIGITQGTVLCVDTSVPLCYTNQGDAICQDRHERKAKAEFIV